MKAFYFVAVVAAAVASVNARARAPAQAFNCSGKPDGNYANPNNCNGFISCSGCVMYERDCAICTYDPIRCPNERTVYNATVDQCLWADETSCGGGGGEVTEGPKPTKGPEPTEGPKPTEGPGPTEGPKPTKGPGVTGGPTEPEGKSTPTEDNRTTTESSSGEDDDATPRPPQEGDACDPENCRNEGYCQSYLRCDKDSKKLVREECGGELVWNPQNPNGTEQIHGGNCDTWENLSAEVERQYRSDPECLACFWRATGECKREYLYQAPGLRQRTVLTLSCTDGLVFSEEKETCQLCSDVKQANGSSCC